MLVSANHLAYITHLLVSRSGGEGDREKRDSAGAWGKVSCLVDKPLVEADLEKSNTTQGADSGTLTKRWSDFLCHVVQCDRFQLWSQADWL